jgi:hypothetical protein
MKAMDFMVFKAIYVGKVICSNKILRKRATLGRALQVPEFCDNVRSLRLTLPWELCM